MTIYGIEIKPDPKQPIDEVKFGPITIINLPKP